MVLAILADNPDLSKEKIAERIGMSRATVTRAFAKLVEEKLIKRVGSDKSGHWEIIGKV
jgi:ATP-dependent DNA helicase RecG